MSSSIPQKRCSKCKQFYPPTTEYFHRNKNAKDGLNWSCKSCAKAYRLTHLEVFKRANEKFNQSHPSARAEATKRYRINHPDRKRQQKRDYAKKHPDKIKALNKGNYERHKDVRKAQQREYNKTENARLSARRNYRNHRDSILVKKKEYAANNPLKMKANWQNMRALRLNAEGSHTDEDILNMYYDQEGHCGYCGIAVFDNYHVDHIQPVSKGGSNWPSNLLICCPECNLSKHNKTVEEWTKVRGW